MSLNENSEKKIDLEAKPIVNVKDFYIEKQGDVHYEVFHKNHQKNPFLLFVCYLVL